MEELGSLAPSVRFFQPVENHTERQLLSDPGLKSRLLGSPLSSSSPPLSPETAHVLHDPEVIAQVRGRLRGQGSRMVEIRHVFQ